MDYQSLGFKAGLEIHQQLETGKLFSRFPSIVHDDNPDFSVKRKLRAVAGESGQIDAAAAAEMKKQKEFTYIGCNTSAGLVELDEEPPQPVDSDALHIALQVCKLLHAHIVDEIQFMRKNVVDGSNVSGFQRTGLIALDGYIETSKGRVGIPTICLEEEAAKKIEDSENARTYRLDRLGIALLEIATDATIKDPEHAKECAEILGMILRSTGKVKRGIGTIRQDVNVSISGGARTEIKGFQDLKSIPKVTDFEIKRQQELLAKGESIEKTVRKAEPDFSTSYLRPLPGAARMYPETDIPTIALRKEDLDAIELPELISDKAAKLEKYGLDSEVCAKIAKEGKEDFYSSLFESLKELKPAFIVDTFGSARKQLKKEHTISETDVSDDHIKKVLTLINDNKIPKNILLDVLSEIVANTFDEAKYKGVDESDLESGIAEIVKEKPGLNPGAYMGLVMKKFGGKVDGKKAMEILKKLL